MRRAASSALVTRARPTSACARAQWRCRHARRDSPNRRARRARRRSEPGWASRLARCAVIYSNASMLDKCIRALSDRPATRAAMILLTLVAPAVDAQSSIRSTTPFLVAPAGRQLATVRAGATVRTAAERQAHTQVTLDGYISASLLGSGRDSFPNVVKAPSGARLRSAGRADASIVADLLDGMGVTIISRSGDWVRVRRTGWVVSTALGAAIAQGPAARPAAPRGGRAGGVGAPPAAQ